MKKTTEILQEVNKVMIGKKQEVEKVMMVILAKGHILLEDIPGVGKTTLAMACSLTASVCNLPWMFCQAMWLAIV